MTALLLSNQSSCKMTNKLPAMTLKSIGFLTNGIEEASGKAAQVVREVGLISVYSW